MWLAWWPGVTVAVQQCPGMATPCGRDAGNLIVGDSIVLAQGECKEGDCGVLDLSGRSFILVYFPSI